MSTRRPAKNTATVTMTGVELPGRDEPVDIEVECEMEDQGIGPYEFWGAPGVDTRWCAVAVRATLPDGSEIDIDSLPESVRESAEERAFEEAQDGYDDEPDCFED